MDERSPAEFVSLWTSQLQGLQQALDPGQVPSDELAKLSASAVRLQGELNEWATRLPTYDLRRSEQELKLVLVRLSSAQTAAAPKPKFSFKRQTKQPIATSTPVQSPPITTTLTPATPTAPSSTPPSTSPVRAPPAVPPTALKLAHLPSGYISHADLPTSASASSESLLVSDLRASVVDLLPPTAAGAGGASAKDGTVAEAEAGLSALYLYNLTECVVILPPIRGSVMIHNCTKCVLVLGAHQFRMHDSAYCTIFLHTSSQPIIERSSSLVFGPYPPSLAPSPLLEAPPHAVQDFDHPFASAERPSPSWRPATSADEAAVRVGDTRWRTAEARRAGWAELLRSVL